MRKCAHLKTDGSRCGSPAMREQTLCYFHYSWSRRAARLERLGGPIGFNRNSGIHFPVLEDRRSIQVAIMEVLHAINDSRIDNKRASLLLYGLQLASSNALNFQQNGLSESDRAKNLTHRLSISSYTLPAEDPAPSVEESHPAAG